jgi:parallel beta-helix repeat protein
MCRVLSCLIVVAISSNVARAQEPIRISENTTLDPAKTYGRIVIERSNIVIDGRGAKIVGARDGSPKSFKGIGIAAKGVSGVTLKNVAVMGFETGLKIEDAAGWTIEDCDFSGNFHDPDFGWGENGKRGGMVLNDVRDSRIVGCKANRVWTGLELNGSDGNIVTRCDLSRCSNVGLHLWRACRNKILNNTIDEGIRIKPNEVHARDSCCVLLETGANDNYFFGNSCTKGGDGIFIRSLNGWVSTGNLFVGNDCSFANNNAVECWSPGNTFRANKANSSSYGFWMGGSDRTILEDNEASFNGDPKGNHNSPHLPKNGHAGIVFMFGTGSHVVVRGNRCVGNNGAGIALIGDQDKAKRWKAWHWVIERNTVTGNRWGVYAQNADWVDIGPNTFANNSVGDVHDAGGVTNLTRRQDNPVIKDAPKAALDGPVVLSHPERATFDARASRDPAGRPLAFRFDFGDGAAGANDTVGAASHLVRMPGFYSVGVTVTNGVYADIAWLNVYVDAGGPEIGTEGAAKKWTFTDPRSKVKFIDDDVIKLVGRSSLKASVGPPYSGGRVLLDCPLDGAEGQAMPLSGKTNLSVWVRALNPNIPGWQDGNPLVVLRGGDGSIYRLQPKGEPLSAAEKSEAREGWSLVTVPLQGGGSWTKTGALPASITAFSIGFDSWGGEPFEVWLDGLRIK